MSLEQLEQQIQVATMAMERANQSGDKKLTGKLKKELKSFKKVLEKSKSRLKELEQIKKQCDDLSATREVRTKSRDSKDEAEKAVLKLKKSKDDDSYNKPIIIPWLNKGKGKKKAEVVDQRDEEEQESRRTSDLEKSFGDQEIYTSPKDSDSISSLGSQIFGTSEITKHVNKEQTLIDFRALGKSYEQELALLNSVEETDEAGLLDLVRSRSDVLMANMMTAQNIAEQELKARERYIKATKEHQKLQKAGVAPGTMQWRKSEKLLRDSYAQIEYWEMLGEEQQSHASSGIAAKSALGKLNPRDARMIDFDAEETKARDNYLYAMMHHQGLVNRGVATSSPQWKESQKKLEECLSALQYWEGRREIVVIPSYVQPTTL
ncbi:expressed unknown protein [Seminavis robusta]|uniref:Uncharacterized protein n=1 Tax=Seminavis robusta TaxID=568900 RepID=A0A9N8E1I5_9STRA|nr:expressed unknown protein [Seminavis robusta]|eukprot:Sro453_g146100.1 n/a (377) ;mRNA; f:26884-28186